MPPATRASDARIQDAKASLQGSNLLGLLAEDFGSVGAFFEGECLRMSSASSFYQKKRNLLRLSVETIVSVDAFSEGECLRMSSASPFYQ